MKIRVGVVRGGPGHEYEVSLKSGATVLKNISKEKYAPFDIYIDKAGDWHVDGVKVTPQNALAMTDVVFNALHGEYGEDGKIQKVLEHHDIPFTGSGSFASSIGMNKAMSKDVYKKAGIKTPYHVLLKDAHNIDTMETALKIFKSFPMPAILKPVSGGSSVGVYLILSFDSLVSALENLKKITDEIMVEEYIAGQEATGGVIEDYRGSGIYKLPPIEIRPKNKDKLFDYDAKYNGASDEICPATFNDDIKEEIMRLSAIAHEALQLDHYSRSDFMIHPKRGIYIIETNTLPGLTEASLIPKAVIAVGGTMEHFIDHLLSLALKRKRR